MPALSGVGLDIYCISLLLSDQLFLHIPEAESGLKTLGFCNTEEFVFSVLL